MAKSEETDPFDFGETSTTPSVDAILDERYPNDAPQEIAGTWLFQLVHVGVHPGNNDAGEFTRLSLKFLPIEPVGDDAKKAAADMELDEMDEVYHTMWWTKKKDRRIVREFASRNFKLARFEDNCSLRELIDQMTDKFVVAEAGRTINKRTGRVETQLSRFRADARNPSPLIPQAG